MSTEDAHYSVAKGVGILSKHPDNDDDDGPMRVRGVALPENDRTFGGSGEYKYWPRETIEEAVDALVGTKIVDDRDHDMPDDGDISKIPKQPSARSIVGEVTDSRYEPGVGALYEGDIHDTEIASLVENELIEVSPFVFHEKGDFDDDRNAIPVSRILHWRDLATVAEGAGNGSSIEPISSDSGVAAMSSETLSAVIDQSFDGSTDDPEGEVAAEALSFSHLSYDEPKSGKLDESKIDEDDFKSHYLFPGETKSDSSFPVVDAAGNLRRGNVESAWKLRGDAPGSKEDVEKILLTLAKKFDDPPIDREDADALSSEELDSNEPAEPGADGEEDRDSQMDLTDEEEKTVNRFRALDDPVVVESSVESLATRAEEAGLEDVDEPLVLDSAGVEEPEVREKNKIEALEANVETMTNVLAEALVERRGIKEKTAAALSLNALVSEFENDEGDFDAEALVQEPETGDAGGDPGTPNDGNVDLDEEQEAEADALAESVMTVSDWRNVEAESLSPRQYVDEQYGVDPADAESEQQLRRRIASEGGD